MHKKYSIKEPYSISDVLVALSFPAAILAILVAAWCRGTGRDAVSRQQAWCKQTCGAHKVLVCEMVKDPAWKEDRRAVACLLDPEGREVRFVIEQPEKSP